MDSNHSLSFCKKLLFGLVLKAICVISLSFVLGLNLLADGLREESAKD